MKKWLVAAGLGIAMVASSAQAAADIAVVNMSNLIQQVAQSSGVFTKLDNEFKGRESELQGLQTNLQTKGQRLQRDGSTMKASERSRLEKEFMADQQSFSTKVQAFEQDRNRRNNEERTKLMTRIQDAVKKVADDKGYDVVLDVNSIAYFGKNVKDITSDVSKQVK